MGNEVTMANIVKNETSLKHGDYRWKREGTRIEVLLRDTQGSDCPYEGEPCILTMQRYTMMEKPLTYIYTFYYADGQLCCWVEHKCDVGEIYVIEKMIKEVWLDEDSEGHDCAALGWRYV